MALTLPQKQQCYNTVYAAIPALGNAEYLRSFIAQGGPSASDPVALSALIIADAKNYRTTNVGSKTPTTSLPGFIYDWSPRDAENLPRLG
jgi:hypothetical protein